MPDMDFKQVFEDLRKELESLKEKEEKGETRKGEKMIIHLSDGTKCDYCGRYILTALGFDFGFNGKVFCCKECLDDYTKK